MDPKNWGWYVGKAIYNDLRASVKGWLYYHTNIVLSSSSKRINDELAFLKQRLFALRIIGLSQGYFWHSRQPCLPPAEKPIRVMPLWMKTELDWYRKHRPGSIGVE